MVITAAKTSEKCSMKDGVESAHYASSWRSHPEQLYLCTINLNLRFQRFSYEMTLNFSYSSLSDPIIKHVGKGEADSNVSKFSRQHTLYICPLLMEVKLIFSGAKIINACKLVLKF